MGVHVADAELADSGLVRQAPNRRSMAYSADAPRNDQGTRAARGILIAVIISIPFWALIAFLVNLWL